MDVDVESFKDNNARILSFAYNEASWLIQARWQKWSLNYVFVSCYFMFELHVPCPMCDVFFVCLWFYDKLTWAYLCFVVDEEHVNLLENC
jgi:hypothetical protein